MCFTPGSSCEKLFAKKNNYLRLRVINAVMEGKSTEASWWGNSLFMSDDSLPKVRRGEKS